MTQSQSKLTAQGLLATDVLLPVSGGVVQNLEKYKHSIQTASYYVAVGKEKRDQNYLAFIPLSTVAFSKRLPVFLSFLTIPTETTCSARSHTCI